MEGWVTEKSAGASPLSVACSTGSAWRHTSTTVEKGSSANSTVPAPAGITHTRAVTAYSATNANAMQAPAWRTPKRDAAAPTITMAHPRPMDSAQAAAVSATALPVYSPTGSSAEPMASSTRHPAVSARMRRSCGLNVATRPTAMSVVALASTDASRA
ncbi:MAG: hypothetical protein KH015_00840 [Gordonibacter pamelaeae]|uniref:hypothetical protein n=1 Tax=Gordonibacter TaxID=644652 RepID=UPI00059C477A|nr:hypothetical protein [Gordonibacter pamelaeae]MBS4894334.1 hypothetical protein [Gordonibacter pamelaeae]MCB6310999.1 hypothetical protein [Gordonibacter pamelaeae]HJH73799.1 hypothetical protein [Eggerthellaceae bacterium]